MTQFLHLCDSKKVGRIAKSGILKTKTGWGVETGFYCTPVSMDFYRTHQWLRELKRSGPKSMHAVQFNLAPDEVVQVGRFNEAHIKVTAAEAAKIFHDHVDGLGLEVIVPHSVSASAIQRIYLPNPVIGWRFYPTAKGRMPCGCSYCIGGKINAYRVRDAQAKRKRIAKANEEVSEEAGGEGGASGDAEALGEGQAALPD